MNTVNTDLIAQRAMDRLAKLGFDSCDEVDRVVAAVWLFEAGVSNHGFIGYYSSGKGDLAFHVPTALRQIGAVALATIATEANALFGPVGPDRDLRMRRKQLRTFSEQTRAAFTALEDQYFSCNEDSDSLLEAFLAQSSPIR